MMDDHSHLKHFSRRAFVVSGLQLVGLSVLGTRLAWLQVSQGQHYKMLSNRNRISTKILVPSRGEIVDRFGVPLAINKKNFRVMLIPEQTKSPEQILKKLQNFISLDDNVVKETLETIQKSPSHVPVEIKDELTWKEVASVEVNLPNLSGVNIETGEKRNYPYAKAIAHPIGYTGFPKENEMGDSPLSKVPNFRIGKTGIEKALDKELRGLAGSLDVEVNAYGRQVRDLNRELPVSGKRLGLSIDAELQRFSQTRLEEHQSASAVILDAHSGAVYAMASHPSFDPHIFGGKLSVATWKELIDDPGHPLTNKTISGQYPPASTFKMITALAGLESGVVTPHKRVYCPGHYTLGEDKFHCWKRGGHGSVDVIEALAVSCDTFFYEVSTTIGIDKIASTAKRYGLGNFLDFELDEERPGLVPNKEWKMGTYGKSWTPGETIVASIGQGYQQATPLQLAIMTARLVNGGYAVKPWIIEKTGQQTNQLKHKRWPKMNVDPSYIDIIKRGMDTVVNEEIGTAHASRITEHPGGMGGKTGTAQVKRITSEQRKRNYDVAELPWEQRHHALFVGYAPIIAPHYVCSVVVEHGIGGSSSAAPIARDILTETLKRNPASL